jgi:hypothetical protein
MNFGVKYRWVLYFVLLLQGCGEAQRYAQEHLKEWPIVQETTNTFGHIYNDVAVRQGYILLKSGDTLGGRMKVLPYAHGIFDFIPLLPPGKQERKDIMVVEKETIDYVRIYPDSLRTDSSVTDFINLEGKDLWRLLAKKNDVGIYDNFFPGISRPFGEEMILFEKNKKTRIFHNAFYNEEVLPLLVKFINRRYRSHVTEADFEDARAMIRYILDKEAGGIK